MKKTDNYSLPQWEKRDFIKMEDFNDLTRKTDAALKANADATATGLNAEIAARGEAVAAEAENRSAALAALQASLAAAIGSGGKTCRIFTGSYTGTGTSGSDAPVELVSGFKPMLLMLVHGDLSFFRIRRGEGKYKEQEFTSSGGSSRFYITWEDTKVSWYSTATPSAAGAEGQANTTGETYYYLLLGFSENAEG